MNDQMCNGVWSVKRHYNVTTETCSEKRAVVLTSKRVVDFSLSITSVKHIWLTSLQCIDGSSLSCRETILFLMLMMVFYSFELCQLSLGLLIFHWLIFYDLQLLMCLLKVHLSLG